MSKKEAMKLSLKKGPLCFRVSNELYHDAFQSIGAASMCWTPRPSIETFNPAKASEIATNLLFKIADELEKKKIILNLES